mmetsp:Transcript_60168/g.106540  ORF Transcript_60168/g.106540 Transcript_60168/m.106540 type:complete len:98 (+) Transcript_60168:121-414(+)
MCESEPRLLWKPKQHIHLAVLERMGDACAKLCCWCDPELKRSSGSSSDQVIDKANLVKVVGLSWGCIGCEYWDDLRCKDAQVNHKDTCAYAQVNVPL